MKKCLRLPTIRSIVALDIIVLALSLCLCDAFQPPGMIQRPPNTVTSVWNSVTFPETRRPVKHPFRMALPINARSSMNSFRGTTKLASQNTSSSSYAQSGTYQWNKASILSRFFSMRRFWKQWRMAVRRRIMTGVLAMVVVACTILLPFSGSWAVTGGRTGGGSFKNHSPSSRNSYSSPSMHRTTTLPRPPTRIYHHTGPSLPRPPIIINTYPSMGTWYNGPRFTQQHHPDIINSRISTKDILILTGTGLLLAYGFRNNFRLPSSEDDSRLGPGITVGSLTVAMEVPNRDDPNNILAKLSRISMSADTESQRGIQDLLSSVALELLRQEKSITSAYASSSHHKMRGLAEREFQSLSIDAQSKVDRLTINKFGATNKPDARLPVDHEELPWSATMAIITVNFAIEGDSTKLPEIYSIEDLRKALRRISSDAQVDDCLITAEIVWAPEDRTERLSREETYEKYPNLVPL